MKRSYYIFQNGRLSRKQDSLVFHFSDTDYKYLPVEQILDIYLFGEIDLNTKLLNFLSQKEICIHIFNYYGFYSGSYLPRNKLVSGMLLVKQVEHYLDSQKRMIIARQLVKGAIANIRRNMRYYRQRGHDTENQILEVDNLARRLDNCDTPEELMGVEGNVRKLYYSSWNAIFIKDVEFKKRVKNPPDNMVNTLISYLNGHVYARVLGEIYRTQLDPTISYLHQPGSGRFSLSLDLAEIFKPLLADRLLFSLINKGQVSDKDFTPELNCLRIKTNVAKVITASFDDRLKQTIKHRDLNREVSYSRLIRLECYKLIKHLLGEKEYQPFAIWW